MSNKAGFGRGASEFLKTLGRSSQIDCSGIRITAIVPHTDRSLEVRVEALGGGERERHEFVLLSELSEELSLSVGAIDGELMPEIEYCAEVTRAYFSACSSFAYAPSSLKALEIKLRQKGFEADVAQRAVGFVGARGLVNEKDIAVRRIELMIKKLWGRSRILSKLREEGFGDDAFEEVDKFLNEVDFDIMCALLIEKKFGSVPRDREAREKMFASLTRYGYSLSEIKKAVSIIKNS